MPKTHVLILGIDNSKRYERLINIVYRSIDYMLISRYDFVYLHLQYLNSIVQLFVHCPDFYTDLAVAKCAY